MWNGDMQKLFLDKNKCPRVVVKVSDCTKLFGGKEL